MAKYANRQKLGSGGFGEVYKCQRTEDGAVFAKKVLLATDADSEERFGREVRMLSRLDHPRIVEVVASKLSTRPLWYVMPLYRRSLAHELPGIVGDEDRIQRVFGAIVEGIQYAHEQGVVHRDLKPGNILLNSDDDIVISDFGLGRSLDALTARKTLTGDAFGTPGYVAPEQATDAKRADFRSDVFALGRILYELYTGDNPSAVQDLSRLPPGVALIVDRCTKTNQDERFHDAGDLRKAFTNLWIVTDKKTAEGRIKEMLAKATAQGSLSNEEVKDLSDALGQLTEDEELIQESCVQLPTTVIDQLWDENPHLVRDMVRSFADQVASQGWGFDYVDTLGNACVRICEAIDDPEVRATIAHAIVEVSVSHNRWRVMEQAADLLMEYAGPAEDMAIADALRPIQSRVVDLGDRIKKGKLGPNVGALLENE